MSTHGPAPAVAPPVCARCEADDELIPVTDRDGRRELCPLCVMALVGEGGVRIAVLVLDPWERDDERTDASGPDLPDWPEEKEK